MIRMASYNIQGGVGLDGRFDLRRILDVIGDLDLVGLQEVEVAWDRSDNHDVPALLAAALPDYYIAWGPNIDVLKTIDGLPAGPRRPRRQLGNMILSRWPILWTRNHLLPRYGAVSMMDMQRGALEAVVDLPGGAVRAFSTHLCHLSERQRVAQVEVLRQAIASAPLEGPPLCGVHDRDPSWSAEPALPDVPEPVVLLAGLNAEPDSETYAAVAGEHSARRGRIRRRGDLLDAWDAAPAREGLPLDGGAVDGSTRYTEDPPVAGQGRRLDFVFVSQGLAPRLRLARVLPHARGSDHLPVIVELDDA